MLPPTRVHRGHQNVSLRCTVGFTLLLLWLSLIAPDTVVLFCLLLPLNPPEGTKGGLGITSIQLAHLLWEELLDLKKLTHIWWFYTIGLEMDISVEMNKRHRTCAPSETKAPPAAGCCEDWAWNIKKQPSCLESLPGHRSLQLPCQLSPLLGVQLNKGEMVRTHSRLALPRRKSLIYPRMPALIRNSTCLIEGLHLAARPTVCKQWKRSHLRLCSCKD